MTRTPTAAAVLALAATLFAGCGRDDSTEPAADDGLPIVTAAGPTAPPVTAGTIPPTGETTPNDLTTPTWNTRNSVYAQTGHDGPVSDDEAGERFEPVIGYELGPLPAAITDQQGREDPDAVARQWAGLKVLTSGLEDGPLWPYSVAAHLVALSDPSGQFVRDGRLQRVEVLDDTDVDPETMRVTVAVDTATPAGTVESIVYDIELWRSDDGYWLVAFADVRP